MSCRQSRCRLLPAVGGNSRGIGYDGMPAVERVGCSSSLRTWSSGPLDLIWGAVIVYGNLVALVLLGQLSTSAPQSDPSALVGQLGAARYADREAAAGALERLGRAALPALRAARDHRDPEVRSPGLRARAENRERAIDSTHAGPARLRQYSPARGRKAPEPSRPASRSRSLPKNSQVGGGSASRFTSPSRSISGRPSINSATPPGFSTMSACMATWASSSRRSRSRTARCGPSRRSRTMDRSA